MTDKILVVSAHPDDEVLGCGGTVKKMAFAGTEIYSLILSAGKASREVISLQHEQQVLKEEMRRANIIIGVCEVFTADFPDNAFDSVSLIEIVKKIEEVKNIVRPKIIFTHHGGDMNIDHRLTYNAVLTATRPMVGETVKEVYSFEVPSSTEWNSFSKETAFIPNTFFDVSSTIDDKISAMKEYQSELRNYPHPRSLKYMREIAKVWGAKVGINGFVEAFVLSRRIVT